MVTNTFSYRDDISIINEGGREIIDMTGVDTEKRGLAKEILSVTGKSNKRGETVYVKVEIKGRDVVMMIPAIPGGLKHTGIPKSTDKMSGEEFREVRKETGKKGNRIDLINLYVMFLESLYSGTQGLLKATGGYYITDEGNVKESNGSMHGVGYAMKSMCYASHEKKEGENWGDFKSPETEEFKLYLLGHLKPFLENKMGFIKSGKERMVSALKKVA